MISVNAINLLKNIHFAAFAWLIILPTAMMALDIVIGFLGAYFILKNFQSSIMRAGLVKKVVELLIILIGILFTFGMGLPQYIIKAICLYIILMELMSVMENLDKIGVPLPRFVKDAVNNIGNSIQNDSYEELLRKYNALQAEMAMVHAEKDDLK